MAKRGRKPKVIDLPGTLPLPDPTEPTFEPSHVHLASRLALLGAIDDQIASVFGISRSRLDVWRNTHPELQDAIKEGRIPSDGTVARSLYERALGFKFTTQEPIKLKETFYDDTGKKIREAEKVELVDVEKVVPADTVACIFWLKNRQPAMWRDRIEHTGANGGAIKTEQTIKPELLTPDDRDVLRAILAQATPDEERPVAERGRMQ